MSKTSLMMTLLVAVALAQPAPAGDAIVLETENGKLFGTLELPAAEGQVPVVLIHPGSGPTDGDGNSAGIPGKNNSLKYLAEALAAEGIASVRIDKRGIARSMPAAIPEVDLRFDHFVADAGAWLESLQNDERFSTVTMLGHSEGALIGALAAAGRADLFVSIAGAGHPADETLRKQLQSNLPAELWEQSAHIIDELKAGRTVEKTPPMLYALFRASVQPYLISWFRHDPGAVVKALTIPVLIVQGTTDLQITPEAARSLAAAQPQAKLVMIEGMNHVLKDVDGDLAAQTASYGDPDLPVNAKLVRSVTEFIRAGKSR